ncbi:MAG: hypothetical protein D3920_04270 [Candidatus Electrothrix sp. AW2]|nr:hypothetical protein [Candidatus Electrothrix gigas]MCI5134288.1 hypothetical protein [Candidatus Electrothrix gigas]MCI5189352.1 hypothetical protein [Candidatus Electrothrix gigas]
MDAENGIPLFPSEEIPRILDLVLFHAGKIRKKHDAEREDVLSDRLFKRLRKDKIFRAAPFVPVREHQLFDENGKESQSGRIDINFIRPPGDETYFAIEAKRLHVTFSSGWKSLVSEYVTGSQGMMCFISGKYSPSQQTAAMLGYVFDGDIVRAEDKIAASVRKNAKQLKLMPPHKVHDSSISAGNHVKETYHALPSREFVIYHMLVSVL